MKILLTGAAGFVGSHIVEEFLQDAETEIIALDGLTYAGRLDRLLPFKNRVKFVYHDFRQPLSPSLIKSLGTVNYVIHCGAESHVSRSFENPGLFVESNIFGTLNILEAARLLQPEKFIYVSTDEVFGPASGQPYTEKNALNPTNPYAATKASGELLAYSYYRSFGVPVIITRTMNMFGERQHPEKFIPMTIKKVLNDECIQVHGTWYEEGSKSVWRSGKRHWLHAREQANALRFILKKGLIGETYHVLGKEHSNADIFLRIASILGKTPLYQFTTSNRSVYDFNYSLEDTKLSNLGWTSPYNFETSFENTVRWTAAHQEFLEA